MRHHARALALSALSACGGASNTSATGAATIGGLESSGESAGTSQDDGATGPDDGPSSGGSAADTSGTGSSPLMPTPLALAVDAAGNGVLETGESVVIAPTWIDASGAIADVGATLDDLAGPAGPTYEIVDAAANYAFPGADPVACEDDCYEVEITAAMRPDDHWDAMAHETLEVGDAHDWTLHVGGSFTDVPLSASTYRAVETMLHHGLSAGCGAGLFCAMDPTLRIQAAAFIARAMTLDSGGVPSAGTVEGVGDYDCAAGVALFDDVPADDPFCAEAHYLFSQGVTAGCGVDPPTFCPMDPAQRLHMALFVAAALNGGSANVPQSYTDPDTGSTYDCSPASPDLYFVDVAADDPGCAAIHWLWARGFVAGCGNDQFCPADIATREQSALFVVNGFELGLYGP